MTSQYCPTALDIAQQWFTDYLTQPHEEIGRNGAVCPFVEPSMNAGTLDVREWDVDPAVDTEGMVALVRRMRETFHGIEWAGRNRTLHALVIVLPGIGPDRFAVLDETHLRMKTEFAREGLMLGHFHPECTERAGRNEEFLVSRSPVPMFALRHMAFHDVLFLNARPEWFAAYRARYGKRYERGSVPDPLFAEVFDRARERWGDGDDQEDTFPRR
ncbi:DUF6875 domain-containing protein [Streptomyces sp. NPDC003077]|uniref:DUF6875 domain-containing protein n=1 Tax=Streptomyces sp. NPDC003077 TaxID=3154443 RepID=UPI00339DC8EC